MSELVVAVVLLPLLLRLPVVVLPKLKHPLRRRSQEHKHGKGGFRCIYWGKTSDGLQVLKEFTHGNEENVSKPVFNEVLSDIFLGMATGLKRDPIVILRIDGEDLLEFVKNPCYEPEMICIFSEIASPELSVHEHIVKVFEKLKVEQGMHPASDSWVISNVLDPVLQNCPVNGEPIVSQETFLVEFKRVAESVTSYFYSDPLLRNTRLHCP